MPESYILHLVIETVLLTLSLLFIVPLVTDGGVAVRRNSFFRGVLGVIVIALGNKVLWHLLTVAGAMQVAPAVLFTVGLVALLVNAVVLIGIGRLMPGVLYVRSYGASVGGSLAFMLCGWLITQLL